jgi:hypothetical protein
LLHTVGGLLERTYLMRPRIDRLERFVIGDLGFRRLYAGRALHTSVGAVANCGATTLVRETDAGLAVCVYFPDALIALLERHPPQRGLGAENVQAFATFVEEIDHLLLLAERVAQRREVSLLELELHANVSKYLVLSRFMAKAARPLDPGERRWLRHQLFEAEQYRAEDPELTERYTRAAGWAARYLDRLAQLGPAGRLASLREFHIAGPQDKVRMSEVGSGIS